ncbi:hypothetical protein VNO77_25516 [Canavalia gladiata]|uniref:Uncharacterized protein n=1 Tax=Canavalia gladiata TaxID=3824 RepID=A0AAN9QDM6_CANGL
MDSSLGGVDGSGDEGTQNLHKEKRPSYKRLSSAQTAKLEKFIKECPHPDEAQRRQLAIEVGLEPKQIKFWFQNKRTQLKNQHERADNTTLRVENDRIHSENLLMKEALKNIYCPSCGGPPYPEGEHEHFVQKMQLENAQLKDEHEKVSSLLARYLEKQMSQPELQQALLPITGSTSHEPTQGSSVNQVIDGSSCLERCLNTQIMDNDLLLSNSMGSVDLEKALMSEAVTTAMDELVRLLRVNEPFWIRPLTQEGKLVLHHESYEKIFPKTNHFKGGKVHVEATKHSGMVNIRSIQLVDMFLDADKWANLFPTIVTKAETIKVIESGLSGSRSGALQLMVEEMHILSPLVQPRKFQFLRYCQQVEDGQWVITDVSFDSFRQNTPLSRSWRHPSGCMIQEMSNGCSMVTWVEHVEVDDKIQTHKLYKDFVGINFAYGAERWIMELERMCERFARFYDEKIPNHDFEGGIDISLEGRRSVMNLSHRMLKIFCESLTMSGNFDFPNLTMENNSGVRVCIRKNTNHGQPNGMIVVAATSIWIERHYLEVFEFFIDDKRRAQPYIPSENNAVILQESFTNSMGSYVVYAPTDFKTMNLVIKGEDSSMLPILPSGFVISPSSDPNAALGVFNNGNVDISEGSLLTVAFQILACSPSGIDLLIPGSVAAVNTLLTSTILKIKDALNCNS